MQLAIALSQSEAEEKEKQKLRSTSQILNKTGWCLLLILFLLSSEVFCKVNSVQEACAICFAVHILKFEILQTI